MSAFVLAHSFAAGDEVCCKDGMSDRLDGSLAVVGTSVKSWLLQWPL